MTSPRKTGVSAAVQKVWPELSDDESARDQWAADLEDQQYLAKLIGHWPT